MANPVPENPMAELPDDAPAPGRYRHFKGGEYDVLGLARASDGSGWQVIYRPCYTLEADAGLPGHALLWARPAAEFAARFVRI